MSITNTRYSTSQRGVSLIELLIYVFIMSIMILLTSQFTVAMIRGQTRASEVQRVHQSVRRMATLMNNDLRRAQTIDTVDSVFDDDNGVLEFTDKDGIEIRYELSNAALQRKSGADPLLPITTNVIEVETFNVQHMKGVLKSVESVRITLTLAAGFEGTDQFYRQTYSTSFTIR